MDEQFNFKNKYRVILLITIIAALLVILAAIAFSKPGTTRIWACILMNNQYFLGLSLGAAFFLSVHRVSLSGWHTLLQRLPDAMTSFLPVAFVLMLVIYFGMHNLYPWAGDKGLDKIIEGKRAWLNTPFFFVRMIIYFIGWIVIIRMMRINSRAMVNSADVRYDNRRRIFGGIFLVFFGITVSTSSWDWIMSLDVHWFSTIYGWYVLIGMFVTSLAFIILLVWFLKRKGYLNYIRPDHVHDLAILLFAFSIFWTYQWFSQYELIWYGHLPEETAYYIPRLHEFKYYFFVNLGVNFCVPFFGLISFKSKRNLNWVAVIAAVVLAGHWLDYWLMIMPATAGEQSRIGVFEIFLTIFYLAIFIFLVFRSLSHGPIVIKNDPYLEESLNYKS